MRLFTFRLRNNLFFILTLRRFLQNLFDLISTLLLKLKKIKESKNTSKSNTGNILKKGKIIILKM